MNSPAWTGMLPVDDTELHVRDTSSTADKDLHGRTRMNLGRSLIPRSFGLDFTAE